MEVEGCDPRRLRGHVHDAGGGGCLEGGKQHGGEEVVGEVVGGPHGVEAVAGRDVAVEEDAGVVDLGEGGGGGRGAGGLRRNKA